MDNTVTVAAITALVTSLASKGAEGPAHTIEGKQAYVSSLPAYSILILRSLRFMIFPHSFSSLWKMGRK